MNQLENTILLLNTDIPIGILKHFCSPMNTPDEIVENTNMLFAYYATHNKLPQFIDYLIDREISECYRTPSSIFRRNSVYMRIIKLFLDNEFKEIVTEIISIVKFQMKQSKTKLVLGDTSSTDVQNAVDKIAEIIEIMMEYLFEQSEYPSGFSYFIKKVSIELEEKTPTVAKSAIKNLLFLRTINSELMKQSKSQSDSDSYKALSIAFQWFVGESSTEQNVPVEQNWKISLGEKLHNLRKQTDEWTTHLKELQTSQSLELNWIPLSLHSQLIGKIQSDWKQISDGLSNESKELFLLLCNKSNDNKSDNNDNQNDEYSQAISYLQSYSTEINNQSTSQMIHMSELTMQLNELRNERISLLKLLVEKDPSYSYLLEDD